MKGVKQNWDTEKCHVDLGSLGYGLLGHRGPEHADHRLNQSTYLSKVPRHLEWAECLGRHKNKKGRRGGQAFFYPARIDPMPNRHGCRPLACSSAAASHASKRRLACFCKAARAINCNEVAFHGIPPRLV